MNREEPQQKLHRVNLWLNKDEKDKIKRIAKSEKRSVTSQISFMIQQAPDTKPKEN